MRTHGHLLLVTATAGLACQDYTHVFQPATDRQGTHLYFQVQTPSKADILFVVDNSRSMIEEQAALKASFRHMLEALAPRDTSYRIGLISTDAHGYTEDCCGDPIEPLNQGDGGAMGACQSCLCGGATADQVCYDAACSVCDPQIQLRRGLQHHDGTRGRLLSAYDPAVFDVNALDVDGEPLYPDVDPSLHAILTSAFPTSVFTGPAIPGWIGEGVPHVIDRQTVRANACLACGCTVCEETADDADACFNDCAKPIAGALVTGYFSSNIGGLGVDGWGWEEGLQSALLAVGIEPEDPNPATALNPGSRLIRPGEPNSFEALQPTGGSAVESWLRDDALLAVMFVSDEEDCSMPSYLMDLVPFLEGQEILPPGGYCYRDDTRQFLGIPAMAELLETRKGTRSRVAVGFIGGVQNGGPNRRRVGTPADCKATVVTAEEQPSTACSCLTGVSEPGWCQITLDTTGSGDTCDALASSRYVDFANEFSRHTFDSICRTGQDAFGEALRDFANLATLACFELAGIAPADQKQLREAFGPTAMISVKRTSRDDVAAGLPPTTLPQLDPNSLPVPAGGGWYYEPNENLVCLLGIDRLLGDVYDIFVMHVNQLDFSR